jgi:YVTN family beta-propeller protein
MPYDDRPPPGRTAGTEPVHIRTFLIADVRGYTLFTQERGDEAATKLAARFADVAREVVTEHGGSVIELRGDEALAAFDSARQAILAAAHAQDRFLEETVADPSFPLPVGIGLDAGEAVPLEAGYRGGALNLAARLCGRAGPGEILASQGVVHLARKVEGVRYLDRGDLHLKGLEEPVHVVRVISEQGDPSEEFRRLAPRPKRGPAPVRLARRHPIAAVLVALALVAAVAVPATIALRSGGSGERIAGDAVGIVDLESGKLDGSVPLPSRPGAVATGEGSVWVTLPDRGAVIEIDVETMSIVDTVSVGSNPVGIAVGADSVWVANGGSSTVSRISPDSNNEVVDTIEVPGAPAAIAVNDQGVWVADSLGDTLTPIDPETDDVLASVPVGDQPIDLVDDRGELWVANAASGSVSRVLGGDEVQPVDVGEGPQAVAVGAGVVWVANSLDGTVSRIDPDTNNTDADSIGEGLTDLAFGGGSLWVSLGSAGSVKRIDPLSGSVTTISLGSFAGSVAVGDGALWVSVRGALSAHRGGTLTVVARRGLLDKDSIDPALAYDTLTWTMLSLTNDGLVGFRRVGGVDGATMVPNLARSIPEPADGGRAYTFQLRPGVRYSSGDPVRPEDFRRAIERLYTLGSPGNFYFGTIVGATTCRASSCDLSAGIETDDEARTVTFHLVESDPDFLNKLTMPFAFAVPAGTSDTPAGTTPIPATGPYMIERYTPGRGGEVVLVRNPEFEQWSAARPDGFPDRIVFRLESHSDRQLNKQVDEVLEGDADLLYGPFPGERTAVLKTTHAGQLHSDPVAATVYMFLNTHVAPFNEERVRRALNYAVDRAFIRDEVFGGAARVTCQILPPTFPGYVPYCPYTDHPDGTWTAPDLAKARQLVDASGTAGARVRVWTAPTPFVPGAMPDGRYFTHLLDRLGYDAELKVVTTRQYDAAINDPSQRVQMGPLAWQSDYLAESGFIPALTCKTATTGMGPEFCPPTLERRIEEATNMQLTDVAASHDLWSDLDHDLVNSAPWVPFVNPIWTSLASERLENYQFHPYWGELFDQMWVR